MTVAAGIANSSKNILANFLAYVRLSFSYMKRTKPAESVYANCVSYVKSILTANKKLKIARYRVNHLRYRLNQMEQLIENNNPNSYSNGKSLNLLR